MRILTSLALVLAAPLAAQDYTYGIEANGVVCGYVETTVSEIEVDGAPLTLVEERVFAMLSVLGNEFNTEVDSVWHLVPDTWRTTYHTAHVTQGDAELGHELFVAEGRARILYVSEDDEKVVELPDVVLENPIRAPHLVRDLVERGLESVSYAILEVREGEVQRTTYARVEEEVLEVAGERIETVVVDRTNEVTGLCMRQWLDVESGMPVRMEIPGARTIYLADPSVKKRIELANLDSTIAKKVDVAISDVSAISYMKVRAVLEPTGLRLDAADLNVPGQRFEGTVTGNRVEGVFTIEHPLYVDAEAPAFPPDFSGDASLAEFLATEDLIEADDPVLLAHAQGLTQGAPDSWEAVRRISQWVADNIDYVIPGGIGARDTYDKRTGECGAHSLLLAGLCRTVGIPARVVWGCMYIPNFGGAFGQHAWTEVYMGQAGWIPVDATAYEIDFVDSGHLRIGIYQSFSTAIHMQEMEVLEYRLRAPEGDAADALARLEPYVGTYAHPAGEEPFEVLVQGSGLAVDIPGQVVLALKEPDDDGRWYAKLTGRLYCTFPRDEEQRIAALVIHEVVNMQRRGDPDEIDESVPEDQRAYLGTYRFAAIRADFEVIWDADALAVRDPNRPEPIRLKPTGEPGRWIDEFDKNSISFELGEEGVATALLLDAANRFERVR